MSDNNYWLQRWQDNNIKFNQNEVNSLLVKHFNYLQLPSGSKVLVPLCGKSIDMLWLARQGHQVLGIELSEIACESFFTEQGLDYQKTKLTHFTYYESDNIKLLSGDFFNLKPEHVGDINFIYDRAALIALPLDIRQKYVETLFSLCNKHTTMLLISFDYNQSEMSGPPFSIPEKDVTQLYGNYFDINLLQRKHKASLNPHLVAKGLKKADDLVLHLKIKDFLH